MSSRTILTTRLTSRTIPVRFGKVLENPGAVIEEAPGEIPGKIPGEALGEILRAVPNIDSEMANRRMAPEMEPNTRQVMARPTRSVQTNNPANNPAATTSNARGVPPREEKTRGGPPRKGIKINPLYLHHGAVVFDSVHHTGTLSVYAGRMLATCWSEAGDSFPLPPPSLFIAGKL